MVSDAICGVWNSFPVERSCGVPGLSARGSSGYLQELFVVHHVLLICFSEYR